MANEDLSTAKNNIIHELNDAKQSTDARNDMIQKYIPFIVKSISDMTGHYVRIGDSDELSIGLMAFNEAIDRYDEERGLFLSYAKLVIVSRLKSYLEKSNSLSQPTEIDEIDHIQSHDIASHFHNQESLEEEILEWKKELLKFNITFGDILENKPKHKDKRKRAFQISEIVSKKDSIVKIMFEKYRLPIQLIHNEIHVSVKILEGSRIFIISVIIIFVKELGAIKRWIQRD